MSQSDEGVRDPEPKWVLACAWILVLLTIAALGCGMQWLLFGSDDTSLSDALLRYPMLWILYVLVGLMVGERAYRFFASLVRN